jgi:hypothetical protein
MAQPRYAEISLLKQIRDALFALTEETRKNRETFETAIKVMQDWQSQDKHHHKRNEDKLDALRKAQ